MLLRPLAKRIADHVKVRKSVAASGLDVVAFAQFVPATKNSGALARVRSRRGIYHGLGSLAKIAEFLGRIVGPKELR